MNRTSRVNTHHANSVHLAGWLVITTVEQVTLNTRQQIAIRGELHARKPANAHVAPSDTSYPTLFTGEAARIVLEWAKIRDDKPLKMSVDGRLYRKGNELVALVRYVEVLEVVIQPLTLQDWNTRPTSDPST